MIKFFLTSIHKIGSGVFYSFDSKCDTGFDPRKLTAWTIVIFAGHAHWNYVDKDNIVEVLIVDFLFIALLLGIVTMEQITKFKEAKNQPKEEAK